MPRASLLACLSRFARDAGADLRYGVAVEDVSRDGPAVHVASSAGTLAAPLIVGADGARSRVRDFLASESSNPSLFEPRVLPSPSGGLQYKMLRVPPSFDLKNLSVRPRGGPISRVAATTRDRGRRADSSTADGRRSRGRRGSSRGRRGRRRDCRRGSRGRRGRRAGRQTADPRFFPTRRTDGSTIRTVSKEAYVLPSTSTARRRRLRLGLLPSRDPELPRTANVIRYADHEVWNLKTGPEVRAFLRAEFPQLGDDVITEEACEAFARAEPGAFPSPQYARRADPPRTGRRGAAAATTWIVRGETRRTPRPRRGYSVETGSRCWGRGNFGRNRRRLRYVPEVAAVMSGACGFLVGDAIHAFPPDLGQGVNSALEDVLALGDALECPDDEAVAAYQAARGPAAEALASLVRVGMPFQYDQAIWRKRVFMLGLGGRLSLSVLAGKLLPARVSKKWFPPPAAFSVMDGDDYVATRNTLRRATRLNLVGAAVALFAIGRRVAVG